MIFVDVSNLLSNPEETLRYDRECLENVLVILKDCSENGSQLVIQLYINHKKFLSFDKRHRTNDRHQEGHLVTSESQIF